MNRLNRANIVRLLNEPLSTKLNQEAVERWSKSYWDIVGEKNEAKPGGGKFFSMLYPPPNITGSLHLGHAVTAALQDALMRHRRMEGISTMWIPGFDHAGLGTQTIVENLLWSQEKVTRQEIGKERFVKMINEWKDIRIKEMKHQLGRFGLSLDHDREYFTMDEKSTFAVQTAFKRLFREGIIYRDIKPVFWSEKLGTSVSDIEVDTIEGQYIFNRTGEVVKKKIIPQWFVNAKEMSRLSVEVIENGSIDIIPANYRKSWSSWLIDNGVTDWCISRQSWWGHPIPAYRIENSEDVQSSWIICDTMEEAKEKLGINENVIQDPDLLDTWFSSGLLPLTVAGWPDQEKFSQSIKEGIFPLSIMETGFDILNFWVSKMVMMSLTLENKIPFELILLHGMICDSRGKKMSKSKGNVIDPLDVIQGTTLKNLEQQSRNLHQRGVLNDSQLTVALQNQKDLFPKGIPACGADVLRAYLLSHDIQQEVIRVNIVQIEIIRRLTNKILNIYRFLINSILESDSSGLELDYGLDDFDQSTLEDSSRQVLMELAECVSIANQSFNEDYQLQRCFTSLSGFWHHHLSSIYLGKFKSVLSQQAPLDGRRKLTLQVMITCVVTSTKILHPFMPHITEFLYQKLATVLTRRKIIEDDIDESEPLRCKSFPKMDESSFSK